MIGSIMNSHDLARKLLAMPDLPVVFYREDRIRYDEVENVKQVIVYDHEGDGSDGFHEDPTNKRLDAQRIEVIELSW